MQLPVPSRKEVSVSVRRSLAAALIPFVLGLPLLVSCGPKRPPAVTKRTPATSGTTARTTTEPSEPTNTGPDVQPLDADAARSEDFTASDPTVETGGPLVDIHFDYNQASLTDQARGTLEKHALWLQSHRQARVTVEGHCDERGTAEYNIALGDERAKATKDYLVRLGVGGDRLQTVSYGKERPLDTASNATAWAKNRRAHFLVSR
jgi:peptidoglycan-associated lipoprotein